MKLTFRDYHVGGALQPDKSERKSKLVLAAVIIVEVSLLEDPLLKYSKNYVTTEASD